MIINSTFCDIKLIRGSFQNWNKVLVFIGMKIGLILILTLLKLESSVVVMICLTGEELHSLILRPFL